MAATEMRAATVVGVVAINALVFVKVAVTPQ
jgi:hypothetical protein